MLHVALGVAALVAWLLLELVVRQPGTASSLTGSPSDRRTTPVLVAAYGLAVISPIALHPVGLGEIGDAAWAGVGLAFIGLSLRAWAMTTLGASYARNLRTDAGQALVTSGPYRWLRHPGYAGSLAVWLGASLAFGNLAAAIVVAVLMLLAYGWRIRGEEAMLSAYFGQAYRDYAAGTARLIPGIY